ncbi:hypothetical protein DCC79_11040 [bacterium]|nr:MAG: hypothetical protein DCC79_11040 [bacterium]
MSDGYLNDLLATGESVQLKARQHWITLAQSVAVNGVGALLAVAVAVWARGDGAATVGAARPAVVALAAVAALWALASLAVAVARWWNKLYIVTTRRVIEVNGLVAKTVTDSNLDKVNDVVLRQSAAGRLLDYGDIEIITGSDIGLNRFEWIADPLGFKRVMLDNKEDFDAIARAVPSGAPTVDIPAAIERLGELRERGLVSPEEFERKKAELLGRL